MNVKEKLSAKLQTALKKKEITVKELIYLLKETGGMKLT